MTKVLNRGNSIRRRLTLGITLKNLRDATDTHATADKMNPRPPIRMDEVNEGDAYFEIEFEHPMFWQNEGDFTLSVGAPKLLLLGGGERNPISNEAKGGTTGDQPEAASEHLNRNKSIEPMAEVFSCVEGSARCCRQCVRLSCIIPFYPLHYCTGCCCGFVSRGKHRIGVCCLVVKQGTRSVHHEKWQKKIVVEKHEPDSLQPVIQKSGTETLFLDVSTRQGAVGRIKEVSLLKFCALISCALAGLHSFVVRHFALGVFVMKSSVDEVKNSTPITH
eukprot:jgi/Bigna1/91200/estExt_fgenesh1_pg.C_920058